MIGSFTDSWNLTRKMTPAKIANAGKVLCSYYTSRWSGSVHHAGLPISIAVEPTTSCNLRCPECPSGLRAFSRPTGMLDPELFGNIVQQLGHTLTYLTFYFQGEPYLHPGFLGMITSASKKGIYTATSTNAHFFSDEMARDTVVSGLDRLIISIDGTTPETYAAYRIGGRLNKVLDGARRVVHWKKMLKSRTPHVVFQFLVLGTNEHEIDSLYKIAGEVGVDQVALKTAQVYDYQHGSHFIPTQSKYARYRRNEDGTYSIKNPMLSHCWKMWNSCVITWDGKVVPCCFDKDAHHVLGDLGRQSFRSIWRGEPYHRFRSAVLKARDEIEICRNCTEGTKVWAA